MRPGLTVLALLAYALSALPARAADGDDKTPFFNRNDVRNAIHRALSVVHKAKCGKENCVQATTEEFVAPPVGHEEARIAMIIGAKSARLQWCGMEWKERTWPTLMQSMQARGIHNTRVLAILNLIHGEQFGKDYTNLQALKTCSAEEKALLNTQHPVVEVPQWQRVVNNALLDHQVQDMLQRVLGDLHKTKCGVDPCTPTTDEEKAKPPITVEGARQAMKVGLMSGVAEFCGIDWKNRIFLPYMAHQARAQLMTTRQLAIVSMLFGTMQGYIAENYRKHEKQCSDQMKESLEKQLTAG
jgi:hypothetical protein